MHYNVLIINVLILQALDLYRNCSQILQWESSEEAIWRHGNGNWLCFLVNSASTLAFVGLAGVTTGITALNPTLTWTLTLFWGKEVENEKHENWPRDSLCRWRNWKTMAYHCLQLVTAGSAGCRVTGDCWWGLHSALRPLEAEPRRLVLSLRRALDEQVFSWLYRDWRHIHHHAGRIPCHHLIV